MEKEDEVSLMIGRGEYSLSVVRLKTTAPASFWSTPHSLLESEENTP